MNGILKIAKPGYDARIASEKDLTFDSEKPCLIELLSEKISITTNGDGYVYKEISHNLGYIPEFDFFEKDNVSGEWSVLDRFDVYITTSKLIIEAYRDENTTFEVFYKIYGNRYDNEVGSGNNNVTGRLRVAKAGYDAETEQDARNMVFFSGGSVPKIDEDLSIEISGETDVYGNLELEVNHNLGYVPQVYILWEEGWSVYPGSTMIPFVFVGFGTPYVRYFISSTKTRIEVWNSDPETTHTFKLKVLRDKIE